MNNVLNLSMCSYEKESKTLLLSSKFIGMPREFDLESHHTGKTVTFYAIQLGDPLYSEDGWDGEQAIYRPTVEVKNVDHLVIYNEY